MTLARRRWILLGTVCAAILVASVGLSAPWWVKSPQQLAAEAQPPPLTVLTAPVERRALRDVLVVRGEVQSGRSFDVTPAGEPGIVTAIKTARGDSVAAGTVLVEVNGRPLVALPGEMPAYRDLRPGDSGRDVAQLQAALASLGFSPGTADGVFGPGTKRALADFYRSLGYQPLPVSKDDEERLAGLRRQVTEAERSVEDAQVALDTVTADPEATDDQRKAAAQALDRAKEDLAARRDELARAERLSGPMLPRSEYTFLPTFPARVAGLTAELGAPVTAPLVTLATGDPVVVGTLTSPQKALVRVDAKVDINGDAGLTAGGTVTSVGDLAQPDASGASGFPLTVTPSPPLDQAVVGQSVRLSIEVAVSDGEQLVVPVSALYGGADGKFYVLRRHPDGQEDQVEVEPGLSAQGYVVVTPVDATLEPGDRVAIGAAAS